mmetsp:Transcript_13177/g.35193  ORF Transcript_13177/g.35193 Transcript_13177/m.35193 type:complete len:85 (-) Transcript_13177:276-530(-)
MMHSEEIALHESVESFLKAHVAQSRTAVLERQLAESLPEHTAVVRRFGRYPHRNALYGRETTPEEQAWLDSDDCPGWAKSQMAK